MQYLLYYFAPVIPSDERSEESKDLRYLTIFADGCLSGL
jgi:hypothetical protein